MTEFSQKLTSPEPKRRPVLTTVVAGIVVAGMAFSLAKGNISDLLGKKDRTYDFRVAQPDGFQEELTINPESGPTFTDPIATVQIDSVEGVPFEPTVFDQESFSPVEPPERPEGFTIVDEHNIIFALRMGQLDKRLLNSDPVINDLIEYLKAFYDSPYPLMNDPEFVNYYDTLRDVPIDLIPHLTPQEVESLQKGDTNLRNIAIERSGGGNYSLWMHLGQVFLQHLNEEYAETLDPLLELDRDNYSNRIVATNILYEQAFYLASILQAMDTQVRGWSDNQLNTFLGSSDWAEIVVELEDLELNPLELRWLLAELSRPSSINETTEFTETLGEYVDDIVPRDIGLQELLFYLRNALKYNSFGLLIDPLPRKGKVVS